MPDPNPSPDPAETAQGGPPRPDAGGGSPPPPPVPDPIREAIEAARKAAEASHAAARSQADSLNRFTEEQRRDREARYVPPTPDKDDDEDLDPVVKKALDKKIKSLVNGLDQIYTRDKQADLSYKADLERREAARTLSGFDSVASEVDSYMSSIPLDLRATPGAYREAYYVILGRRESARREEESRRPPQVTGETRTKPESSTPVLSAEDRSNAANFLGITLDDKDSFLLENRPYSINDYHERRASK